jgi:hypothetical protein
MRSLLVRNARLSSRRLIMKITRHILPGFAVLLGVALMPCTGRSEPVLDLSWGDCSPIQHDRVLPAGEVVSKLVVFVNGMDQPHQAFQFQLWFGEQGLPCAPYIVPDAWRFDFIGCQGSAYVNITTASTSKTCPALAGTPTNEFKDLSYNSMYSQMILLVAASYATRTPDPNVTYRLGTITFDHTYAVTGAGVPGQTCGGFEKPICITTWGGFNVHGDCDQGPSPNASYLDANGVEHPFGAGGPGFATFRIDPSIQACSLATPAEPRTWGSIKAQYR